MLKINNNTDLWKMRMQIIMIDFVIEKDLELIKIRMEKLKNKFKHKKFLVVGGSGFLGSWICDVLTKLDGEKFLKVIWFGLINLNLLDLDMLYFKLKHMLMMNDFFYMQEIH